MALERALDPTPQMLQAHNRRMADYFFPANPGRTRFVGTDTSIDPSLYSPRNFVRVEIGLG